MRHIWIDASHFVLPNNYGFHYLQVMVLHFYIPQKSWIICKPQTPMRRLGFNFSRMLLGDVWLEVENWGEKSNLNYIFISIVWLDKIYNNLISIRI